MLSGWSTFSHNLLHFKKCDSCLPDSYFHILLMGLIFPLLIEYLFSRGSNGISLTVVLWNCFFAEMSDSSIPLISSPGDYGQDCLLHKGQK